MSCPTETEFRFAQAALLHEFALGRIDALYEHSTRRGVYPKDNRTGNGVQTKDCWRHTEDVVRVESCGLVQRFQTIQ
jgi:hypothetical protein